MSVCVTTMPLVQNPVSLNSKLAESRALQKKLTMQTVADLTADIFEGVLHLNKLGIAQNMGTRINTGTYQQVWKALGKKATYADYWTVKVDA